jgi:hypothetical protein
MLIQQSHQSVLDIPCHAGREMHTDRRSVPVAFCCQHLVRVSNRTLPCNRGIHPSRGCAAAMARHWPSLARLSGHHSRLLPDVFCLEMCRARQLGWRLVDIGAVVVRRGRNQSCHGKATAVCNARLIRLDLCLRGTPASACGAIRLPVKQLVTNRAHAHSAHRILQVSTSRIDRCAGKHGNLRKLASICVSREQTCRPGGNWPQRRVWVHRHHHGSAGNEEAALAKENTRCPSLRFGTGERRWPPETPD